MIVGTHEYELDQTLLRATLLRASNHLALDLRATEKKRKKAAKRVARKLEEENAIDQALASVQLVRDELAKYKLLPIANCSKDACPNAHPWSIHKTTMWCPGAIR